MVLATTQVCPFLELYSLEIWTDKKALEIHKKAGVNLALVPNVHSQQSKFQSMGRHWQDLVAMVHQHSPLHRHGAGVQCSSCVNAL